MTDPVPSRLNACLASPGLRWGLGGLAMVGVGAAALLLVARPEPAAADIDSPLIQIRLVAPAEPEVEPGAVMDVGDLRDDFDRAALIRAEAARRAEEQTTDAYAAAYVEDDDRHPVSEPYAGHPRPALVILPAPPPRREIDLRREYVGSPTAYGFDAPRADYAAERRARRAERAAYEAALREQAYLQDRRY